ncbi:hypothetical protein SASPL_157093 [Salvia splendens]|uniref:DC1 domain-containing protein n=1 Tax=Salvia splendens TaxID=180675 RepID=A0A8X8VVQ2_SALSN|nr:hypothetical protein SASPL_157093 [Salvia splendens]
MPQLRHVMTYEGTLDAAYGLNGDMNGQDGVFVLEHLQSLFVMSNLNFGEGLVRRIPNIKRHSIMEKKVIDRFYHEHPLILIENVSNDETPNCYGCGIPVNDLEVAYVCTVQNCSNRIILHKKCGELPSQILHPKHPEHPLYLFDYHRSLGLWCDMCTCDLGKMLGCVASTTTEIADEDSNLGGDDDGFDVVEFPLHARDISKELITPFVMREKGLNNIPDVADMPATVKMPETTARFSFLFNYHNHPLSLVSELPHKDDEVDHNDIMDARGEDDVLKICDVCVTPISSPPYYACAATACIFFSVSMDADFALFRGYRDSVMEKKVIDWVDHEHPLILTENVSKDETPNCYGCGIPVVDLEVAYVCTGLGYQCSSCDFDVDLRCERIRVDDRLEGKIQVEHPSHPDHPLTLMRKPLFPFCCDGCGVKDVDMAYICSTCEFMILCPYQLVFRDGDDKDGLNVIEFPLHAHDISKEVIEPFVMREKGLNNIPEVADMPAEFQGKPRDSPSAIATTLYVFSRGTKITSFNRHSFWHMALLTFMPKSCSTKCLTEMALLAIGKQNLCGNLTIRYDLATDEK